MSQFEQVSSIIILHLGKKQKSAETQRDSTVSRCLSYLQRICIWSCNPASSDSSRIKFWAQLGVTPMTPQKCSASLSPQMAPTLLILLILFKILNNNICLQRKRLNTCNRYKAGKGEQYLNSSLYGTKLFFPFLYSVLIKVYCVNYFICFDSCWVPHNSYLCG